MSHVGFRKGEGTVTYVTGSSVAQGPGWWLASDHKWYPPELHPDFGKAAQASPVATKQAEAEKVKPSDSDMKPKPIAKTTPDSLASSVVQRTASSATASPLYETELPLGSHLVLLGGGTSDAGFSPVSAGSFRLPSSERVKELVAEFLARTGKKQRMIALAILAGAVVAENVAAVLLHSGVH